jgi:hypothetical protein
MRQRFVLRVLLSHSSYVRSAGRPSLGGVFGGGCVPVIGLCRVPVVYFCVERFFAPCVEGTADLVVWTE